MIPLVEPGPPLTAEQVERAARHLLLPGVGEVGQRRLRAARVLVLGAGGLGAPVLQYLAAAGVGTLGIVDDDVVDASNLQRQVVHGTADVGRPKVDSARAAVLALDPTIVVETFRTRLTSENVSLLDGWDVVVDGTDNFPTRYLVADESTAPVVWGSVLRFDAQVSVFWRHAGVTLRDLFPEPPAPDEVPSCAEAGVLGALCGQVGSVMATEVVKLLTGAGDPLLGRVLVVDALRGRWETVPLVGRGRVRAREDAPEAATRVPTTVPTITARDLAARLADPFDPLVVLDVREPAEVAVAAFPGAVHAPLATVLDGTAPIPDGELVVLCAVGGRSLVATRALRERGRQATNLEGGLRAWLATT